MQQDASREELNGRIRELEEALRAKEAERSLQQSRELLEKTFRSQMDAVLILDEGIPPRIVDCNPAAEKIFGYSRQEMLNRSIEFLHVDQAALKEFQARLYPEIAERGFFHLGDFAMKRGDGVSFPTDHTVAPLNSEDGRRTGWVSVVRDITERKQLEEAMRKSNERYRLLADNVSDVIFIRGMDLRFTYISPSVEKMTGYSAEEVMALTMAECYTPQTIENAMKALSEELAMEAEKQSDPFRVRTLEMEGYRKDGSIIWTEAKMRFLRDPEGRPVGILGVSRDITARKLAEEALRRLNETLEQRVAERTRWAESREKQLRALVAELTITEQRERKRLAGILHDHLQQLLVGAKMGSEVLSAQVGTKHRQAVKNIQDFIGQSIRISRSLTAELSPPILQQGSLSAALQWLARWVQENYGLTVNLKTDPSLDPEGEDINLFLFQSIRELLFNALKHAGVKSVRVETALDAEKSLRVDVIDEGAGFNPETIWKKAETDAKFGLFSIRERLTLLGGRFEIQSSPGNGACFSLIVPLETRLKNLEKNAEKALCRIRTFNPPADRIRVLLVDDHTVVRQGLSAMLNLNSDIEVVGEAADGREAVEKASKIQPDVILMDISMPVMDGIEATRKIHAEFPHILIIGLSMYDKDDQADRMMEAGASAYCAKDGETADLLAAIRGKTDRHPPRPHPFGRIGHVTAPAG